MTQKVDFDQFFFAEFVFSTIKLVKNSIWRTKLFIMGNL